MINSYSLHGDFLESCDCFDLCPCWVDDDPDEDHCTGLVAWRLAARSTVTTEKGPVDLSGTVVAAVTGHSGARRRSSAMSVLFVDVKNRNGDFGLLVDAFTGEEQATDGGRRQIVGPLGALAKVTGTVLRPACPAEITFPDGDTAWSLTIVPRKPDGTPGEEAAVRATGVPRSFPNDPLLSGEAAEKATDRTPLELHGTALHAELQIRDAARAQTTDALSLRVPVLSAGYLEVKTRSGMRGEFAYSHPPARAGQQV
jgi:hypothetical protein